MTVIVEDPFPAWNETGSAETRDSEALGPAALTCMGDEVTLENPSAAKMIVRVPGEPVIDRLLNAARPLPLVVTLVDQLPINTELVTFSREEWPVLTALDGRPPLLLLDDVFSELDPDRRSHLVRRIAALPQAFVTTTTLDDLDPGLRAIAHHWEVRADAAGARLVGGAGVPG